jgi:hypothetical protein
MTGKAAFAEEEWELLREGPSTAGLIVVTAERGGSFRESFAMAKAYTEARKQHGESELLDELVSAGPKSGKRAHSPEDLRQEGLQRLRDVVALLEQKATPQELEDYRSFVLDLAKRVAAAHKEHGQQVSQAEQAAIDEIAANLGAATT